MAGYSDTKNKILSTLIGRPVGEEIQPENHQDYALNMLEYIRSIELLSVSPLVDIAYSDTVPVQPNDSKVSYLAGIPAAETVTFHNFHDNLGVPITVEADEDSAIIVILIWDTQYWNYKAVKTGVIFAPESGNFYYGFSIKKTYTSVANMNADSLIPIGDDGKKIKIGEIVSVRNPNDDTENALYSRTEGGWQLQGGLNFNVLSLFGDDANAAISQKFFTMMAKYITSGQIDITSNAYNKFNSYNSIDKSGLYAVIDGGNPIGYLFICPTDRVVKQTLVGNFKITAAGGIERSDENVEIVRYYESNNWTPYIYRQTELLAGELGQSETKGVTQKFFSDTIHGNIVGTIKIDNVNLINTVLNNYNSVDKVGFYTLLKGVEKWGLLEVTSDLDKDLIHQKISSNLTLDNFGAVIGQNKERFRTISRFYNIDNMNMQSPKAGFWTVWSYDRTEENVVLSEEEYNILVDNNLVDPNTFYYIYEE